MQATLTVSGGGLIAIPAAMLKAAGIYPQDSVVAETTAEGILLRPSLPLPEALYSPKEIAEFDAGESELEQAVERGGRPTIPDWIARADEALKRAAQRARDVAIQTNTGILVMIEGEMVTITAEELRAERDKGRTTSKNWYDESSNGASE